jgi:hypothetical protein
MFGAGASTRRGARASTWRGAAGVDAVRVLVCASVAGTAAAVLSCLLAWARPIGGPDRPLLAPLLAALPVLATVAVLTAVATRLAAPHRPGSSSATDVPTPRMCGVAAAEAATIALVGAVAGVQGHLALRALPASTPAPVRHLLAVGTTVPWMGLVAVLVLIPIVAAPAAGYAVRISPGPARWRIPPYVGPLLVLAGLLTQYLVIDPGRPGQWTGAARPAAMTGYTTLLLGAALTVPWLVKWAGIGWAARTREAWSLCAARQVESSAGAMGVPLGLTTVAVAVLTTNRLAGERARLGMSDAPLLVLVATASVSAAATLFAVIVEHGSTRRETSRTLHSLGATTPVDRRAALTSLALPVAVCVATGLAIGAPAAWLARAGSPFPTVSTRAADLGGAWTVLLLAALLLSASWVILRDESARRRGL